MIPKKTYIDADEKYVRNYVLYVQKIDQTPPVAFWTSPDFTEYVTDSDMLKKMLDCGLRVKYAGKYGEETYIPAYYTESTTGTVTVTFNKSDGTFMASTQPTNMGGTIY